jgi:HPt (histidine-containing phosphotransfer) domain-containing protein
VICCQGMEFDQRLKSYAANGSTREAYDRSHLLASVDGNAEIAREIVALYVNESAVMIRRLGQTIEQQDLQAIETAAHRLKGAMLAVGASAAALAGDLEELAKAGELSACGERFVTLTIEAKALNEALIQGELGGVLPRRRDPGAPNAV